MYNNNDQIIIRKYGRSWIEENYEDLEEEEKEGVKCYNHILIKYL